MLKNEEAFFTILCHKYVIPSTNDNKLKNKTYLKKIRFHIPSFHYAARRHINRNYALYDRSHAIRKCLREKTKFKKDVFWYDVVHVPVPDSSPTAQMLELR